MLSVRPAAARTASLALLAVLLVPLVHAQNVPDPTPQVMLSKTSLAVTEGGATASYTVSLSPTPTAPVHVAVTSAKGQVLFKLGTAAPAASLTLDFTPSAANPTPSYAITVVAKDDAVVEGTRTDTIHHVPDTGAYKAADATATVTDNDPGLALVPARTPTQVNERTTTSSADYDSFTVALGTAPTQTVTVSIAPGPYLSTSKVSFDVTPANWQTPKSITVYAINDDIAQGDHTSTVTVTTSSSDPTYQGRSAVLPVTIHDTEDHAGWRFAAATGSDQSTINQVFTLATIAEGSPTGVTFRLHPNSQPTGTVTVTPQGDAGLAFSPASQTFGPSDWRTGKPFTVTKVDDFIDQPSDANDNYQLGFTLATASADPNYNAAAIATSQNPWPVTIADNDYAAIRITHPGGGLPSVTEGGASDTLQVVLGSQPANPVTLNLASDPGQVTLTPASLVFTPANWNTVQTVTIAAVDDTTPEPTRVAALNVTPVGDAQYAALAHPRVNVTVLDNDGVLILTPAAGTTVAEGGTATFTVKLIGNPPSDTTVALASAISDSRFSFSPSTLTFGHDSGVGRAPCPTTQDPGRDCLWSKPQTVTLTLAEDQLVEGTVRGTMTFHVTGGFNDDRTAPYPLTLSDNDIGGVFFNDATTAVNSPPGAVAMNEGTTKDYKVKLNTQPTADVTITPVPDATLSVTPDHLTFTPDNWNGDQAFHVTAVQDHVQRPTSPYILGVGNTITTSDARFATSAGRYTFSITEEDHAKIDLAATGGSTQVTEGGATDTVTVALDTIPTGTVTVDIVPPSDVTVSPATLTFGPDTWNVAQTVTLTAVDDNKAQAARLGETLTASIDVAGTADAVYRDVGAATTTVDVFDNDGVLVLSTLGPLQVVDGGDGATYTVKLVQEPTADVTVHVSSASGLLKFNGQSTLDLQFAKPVVAGQSAPAPCAADPKQNCAWDNPQTISVTAPHVAAVTGPVTVTIDHAVSSGDTRFKNPNPSIPVVIGDAEAGLLLVQSGGSTAVTEGSGPDTYTVMLSKAPTASVTIDFAHDARLSHTPAELFFDDGNWNVPQTVTVSAPDDHIDQPNRMVRIQHTAGSFDGAFNGVNASLDVALTDVDHAGVVVTESGGNTTVTEGGAPDAYTLALSTQPAANVQVTLTPSGPITLSASSVTFTPSDWMTPQTVNVTAVNDNVAQGTRTAGIAHTVSSGDPGYNGIAVAGVAVTVLDNDKVGVLVTESGGSTVVRENGATDTFTVALASQPTADVHVTLSPDPQLGVSSSQLTFTAANWNVAQTVTVSGINDDVAQGTRTVPLAFSVQSGDAGYAGLAVPSLHVTIRDDDTAGVLFGASASNVQVTEGGAGSSYSLRLQSQPTANVTITFTPDSQVTVGKASLTFTPANWRTYQMVTVAAVDDNVHEGPHNGYIAHSARSSDPVYNGLSIATVVVSITDND